MLITVTNHNSHLYQDELDQMFALRHRVLVDGLGWEDLRSPDGLERDQFDNSDAIYLLSLDDETGQVAGCSRFTPTEGPTLTKEVFPDLCDLRKPPAGKDIYDLSRLAVDDSTHEPGRRTVATTEILAGWFELGLCLNLKSFVSVTDTGHLTTLLSHGWHINPLGLPRDVNNQQTVAIEIEVREETLMGMRKRRAHDRPVLSKSDIGLLIATHELAHVGRTVVHEPAIA